MTNKEKEKLGKTAEDTKAVYDIYSENSSGEKIILELQSANQNYFNNRKINYL